MASIWSSISLGVFELGQYQGYQQDAQGLEVMVVPQFQ